MDIMSAFAKSCAYYTSSVYEYHHRKPEEAWEYRILVGVRSM